jgi:hypothetical protein
MESKKTAFKNPLQDCKKQKPIKKTKTPRCPYLGCNKKIKHILGPCKCEVLFCQRHRLPHLHSCKVKKVINKLEFIKNNGLGGRNIKQIEAI